MLMMMIMMMKKMTKKKKVKMKSPLTGDVGEEGEDDVEDKVATTSSHHQDLL